MSRRRPLVFAALLGQLACTHREPPTPDGPLSVAVPTPGAPPSASTPLPSPTTSLSIRPSIPSAAGDAGLFPQTRDVPHASGTAFDARVAALWRAIVQDDPEAAMPFFFPLTAYEQVKDVGNPAADWKNRLVAAYARDIHALHGVLAGDAQLTGLEVRLEVPEGHARWVEPGEEYNKIGYFRVFGSKLRYESGGASHAFDVKSLISWRGQWYVVHLSAIK